MFAIGTYRELWSAFGFNRKGPVFLGIGENQSAQLPCLAGGMSSYYELIVLGKFQVANEPEIFAYDTDLFDSVVLLLARLSRECENNSQHERGAHDAVSAFALDIAAI